MGSAHQTPRNKQEPLVPCPARSPAAGLAQLLLPGMGPMADGGRSGNWGETGALETGGIRPGHVEEGAGSDGGEIPIWYRMLSIPLQHPRLSCRASSGPTWASPRLPMGSMWLRSCTWVASSWPPWEQQGY